MQKNVWKQMVFMIITATIAMYIDHIFNQNLRLFSIRDAEKESTYPKINGNRSKSPPVQHPKIIT